MFFQSSRLVFQSGEIRRFATVLGRDHGGEVASLLNLPSFCIIFSTLYSRQKNNLPTFLWCFLHLVVILPFKRSCCILLLVSTMATKIKGIYKSFKYISQIFVVKEREMEIGYPTDVKHVAHIGWDGSPGSAPSWMNEFSTGPDFSAPSYGGNPRDSSSVALSTWASQADFEQSMGQQPPVSEMFRDIPPTDLPNAPKKQKRKKKSNPSPKCSSSSRCSRSAKSMVTFN